MNDEIQWYAISNDLEVTTHTEPSDLEDNYCWLKRSLSGRTHSNKQDNTYDIYYFEILDNDLEPLIIEEEGWKLVRVYDGPFMKGAGTRIKFEIADQLGKIQRFEHYKAEDIVEVISSIKEYSKCRTWEEVALKERKEDLKEWIEEKETEIDGYDEYIDKLKTELKDTDYYQLTHKFDNV